MVASPCLSSHQSQVFGNKFGYQDHLADNFDTNDKYVAAKCTLSSQ